MKTTHSDNIVVIGGNVETLKTAQPNAFVLLSKRQDHRYGKFCNHCRTYETLQHGGHVSRAGTGRQLPCRYW